MALTFRQKFLQATSGTLIAQGLSLAFMPIVTRIYSPTEVGEYALAVSIYSIVAIGATLRLEMAVVIAKNDAQARLLSWLAMMSSILVALALFFVLIAWKGLNAFTIWTSVAVIVTGVVQTLANWSSRQEKFRDLSVRNVSEKLAVLLLGLGFGIWGYTQYGLLAAQVLGLALAAAYLAWRSELKFKDMAPAQFSRTLRDFADFPLKNILSSLSFAMAVFLPSLLFARNFQLSDLGQYNLTSRLLDVPVTMVGFGFSTAYFQHAASRPADKRKAMFWKSVGMLALLFAPPLLVLGFFGTPIFTLVFGEQWATAGSFALWLAPFAIVRLIYVSQSSLLLVQRRLSLDLVFSGLLLASQVGGFYLGMHLDGTVLGCVQWMALLGAAAYAFGLALIFAVL